MNKDVPGKLIKIYKSSMKDVIKSMLFHLNFYVLIIFINVEK